MDMDGKTVRVDKVDFQNEEVSLTDITDRKNPVPFRERLSIVPVSYTHLGDPARGNTGNRSTRRA